MSAQDAYEFVTEGDTEMTTLVPAGFRRPGLGSWLAFLLIGICAMTWARNEQVVAWLMSRGVVGESAIAPLLGAVRWASVAGGILGLIAVWPVATRSGSAIHRWGPVQAFTTRTGPYRCMAQGACQ